MSSLWECSYWDIVNRFCHALASDKPRGRVIMQYLSKGLYLIDAPEEVYSNYRGKISIYQWQEIKVKSNTMALRQLAIEYKVSHETIWRALKASVL